MAGNGAHNTVAALQLGINSMENYAAKLDEFDKNTRAAAINLRKTHRDQNYDKFYATFEPFWKNVENFKDHVDEYKKYLIEKHKQIEDYEKAGNL